MPEQTGNPGPTPPKPTRRIAIPALPSPVATAPSASPRPTSAETLPEPPSLPAPMTARVAPATPAVSLSLTAALAEARELANQRNDVLESLNEAFYEAESALRPLGLNVYAYVRLASETDYEHGITDWTDLAYARTDGGWGFVIECGNEVSEARVTPLARASKDTRLLAASRLEELIHKIIQRTREDVLEARTHVELVRGVTKALREVSP